MQTGFILLGAIAIFPLTIKWVGELMEYIDERLEHRRAKRTNLA
jgi:hypothetical protein